MSEYLKRDQNHVTVQGAVTDDANLDVEPWKVDPATGRLLVSAVVAGSENGKILVSGDDTTYDYLETKLVAGTGVTLTVLNPGGNETLEIAAANAQGYYELEDGGVSLTQRGIANFVNYFTLTDDGGNSRTNISINTGELGADATLISTLESNLDLANISGLLDLSTQVTGLLSSSNIDITDLESTLDLANIAGFINVSTQVTGVLPVVNGGTGVNSISGVVVGSLTSAFTGVSSNVVGRVLRCTGSNTYAFGAVDLADTDAVTGVLDETNGGTGQSTISQGDLLYGSAANTISKLAKDTNATRYLSNTGTSNNPTWAQVDLTNGVTGILPPENGGGGAIIVTNVTVLDDFIHGFSTYDNTNTNEYITSGNFYGSRGIQLTDFTGEANHPGIVRMSTSGDFVAGFTRGESITSRPTVGLLSASTDFEIVALLRKNKAAVTTPSFLVILEPLNVAIDITDSAVKYNATGGVVTTGETPPADNTWYSLSFIYSSGTLTLKLNSTTLFSGAVALSGSFNICAEYADGGGSGATYDIDYIKTNYQVTR